MAAPVFTARHFRAEREAEWERLERLLDLVERKSPRRLSDRDLIELPRLYRATLSALSVARATSLDAALISYLESLSVRAYFILYGCREPWATQLRTFFVRGWPRAVRALLPETLVAFTLLIASIFAGYALVVADPAWFGALMPDGMAAGRNLTASTAFLRETLYDPPRQGGLEVFATFLFTHNAQISILSFALGFAFGVPTLLLLASFGAGIGALTAAYVPHGLGWGLWGWLLIHGTTELSAATLSAAAGLHIGRAVAFPGDRARLAAAAEAGRTAATVMIGAVLMLCVAGLLEGFARQLIVSDMVRYAIGTAMFALWLGYFGLAGRARG